LDGKIIWTTCAARSASEFGGIFQDGNYVYLSRVAGRHTVVVNDSCFP
jgi:hypothetical protein